MKNSTKKWLCEKLGIYCQTHKVTVCADSGQAARPWCPTKITRQYYVWVDPPLCELHNTDPGQVVEVEVCRVSGLLPGPFCLQKIMGTFKVGEEPTTQCTTCAKAYPADTPKPDWMPRMTVAWLSGHVLLHHYSDKQLENFAQKISLAGIDYVRIMMCWDDPAYQAILTTTAPYTRDPSSFNLDVPNPAFDLAIERLRDVLMPYHVRIHFDLFDNCDAANSPWARNVNSVNGIYDSSDRARGYFFQWADRIMKLLPASGGHRIGIGNELMYPNDAMGPDMEAWVRGVVIPLGEKLHLASYLPTPFSAAPNTGHWIHGGLSPDVSKIFGIRDAVMQVHWQALVEEFDPAFGSDIRAYGYSDDGATVRVDGKKGYCTKYPRCQATPAERLKLITAWWAKYETPQYSQRRLDHIEFLPGEISDGEAPDQILPESLDVYALIATTLWGAEIRRKYPDAGGPK